MRSPKRDSAKFFQQGRVYTSVITGTPEWFKARTHVDRYTTMAWVDHKGKTYVLGSAQYYLSGWSPDTLNDSTRNHDEGWRVVEVTQSRRSKAAAARSGKPGMTHGEKDAIDAMVLRVLDGYNPSGWLPTANALARDIFDNHNYRYTDLEGADALSDAAFKTTYSTRAAASAVRASLSRLQKARKVTMMYGSGDRRKEAQVFCLTPKLG